MTNADTIQKQRSALAPILLKVRALRKRLALWFTLHGLVRILAFALLVFAVDLLLDRFLQMDRAQRTIMLFLMVGSIGWIIWKKLLRPLCTRVSDDALVVALEKHAGKKDSEAVLSALELGRMDWSKRPDVSPALVQSAIARGAKAGKRISIGSIIEEKRIPAYLAGSLLFGLLLAGGLAMAIAKPGSTLGIWAQRNLLLSDTSWPQDHMFDIDGAQDGVVRVPRGDDWTLTARVRDGAFSLPQSARIEFDRDGSRRIEGMTDTGDRREFTAYLPPVAEPFTFRILSKQVTTNWFKIEVVERPQLESLELIAVPPPYTGEEPQTLTVGSGPYRILAGSSLRVGGSTRGPVASVHLELPEQKVELALDASGTGFSGGATSQQLQSGSCILDVAGVEKLVFPGEDTPRGLDLRDPVRFRIRIIPDKVPAIQARLAGLSGLVTPRAVIPLTATIRDDYGLTSSQLTYSWKKDASEAEENTGVLPIKLPNSEATVEISENISLESIGVTTGSRLSMSLEAADNDTVSGPKTGVSTRLLLRVVSDLELRTDFLRREKEQQQILNELVEKQDLLSTDVRAFSAETRNAPLLDPSARSRLSGFEKQQSRITIEIASVIMQLNRIVEEIEINRLPDANDALRNKLVDRVIAPLAEARDGFSPEASALIDEARLPDANQESRAQLISEAALVQSKVIGKLKQALRHLVKNEDFQLAVNMLYDLQKSQEDVLKLTDAEKLKRINQLLEEGDEEKDK